MNMELPKITWNSTSFLKGIDLKEKTAITKGCLLLERDIKMSMKTTPRDTAKKYRRQKSKKGIYHHPSLAGYPPAIDTGHLVNSISHNFSWGGFGKSSGVSQPMAKRNEKVGVVGTALKYKGKGKIWDASILEFGTKKMKARPFLRPAFYRNQNKIIGFFK